MKGAIGQQAVHTGQKTRSKQPTKASAEQKSVLRSDE